MVTLPARPVRSASEWLVRLNFTRVFFFASSVKRIPEISMYFCTGFVLAPGLAAGLSTDVEGAAAVKPPLPRRYPTPQYTPATNPRKAKANKMVSNQVGSRTAELERGAYCGG